MMHYIAQVMAFQLLFLLVYDVFLKRETFFNWNRAYLLLTAVLSFVIPFIKIEKFKTVVPQEYTMVFTDMFVEESVVTPVEQTATFSISWQVLLYAVGALVALILLFIKLHQLYKLKKNNKVEHTSLFTKILVKNSTEAFSFLKNIFLGEVLTKQNQKNIIAHELVHVQQKHTYDLLFFELLKIVWWFNPMVYVYQHKMAELHEFIADAVMAKTNKKAQYEQLLSSVFQTPNISFINQLAKKSLIKNRIIMLSKQKSKAVFKLKYLLLLPLVCGLLVYTSCELEDKADPLQETSKAIVNKDDEALKAKIVSEIEAKLNGGTNPYQILLGMNDVGQKIREYKYVPIEDYYTYEVTGALKYKGMMGKTPPKLKSSLMKFYNLMADTDRISYTDYSLKVEFFSHFDKFLKPSVIGRNKIVTVIKKFDGVVDDKTLVVQVENTKDLTGDEMVQANRAIDAVVIDGSSETAIITDGTKAAKIIKNPNPLPGINELTKTTESSKTTKISSAFENRGKNDGFIYGNISHDGQPLPGVNILLKGTNTGLVTDFDGNFKVKAPKGTVLALDYIGLPDKEVKIANTGEFHKIEM